MGIQAKQLCSKEIVTNRTFISSSDISLIENNTEISFEGAC